MKWSQKDFSVSVEDVDAKKGIVEAYANIYNNVDYAKDISGPGSFTKTVQENRKKIRVLKDHFWDVKLGVPLEIRPDDPKGLFTVTLFNMEKQVARDMFTDIQLELSQGQESDLSIGYDVMKRDQKDNRIIREYKLHEYSFLTFLGANPLAVVQDAKALQNLTEDQVKKYIDELVLMYNANYSDAKKVQLEVALKALDSKEPVITTQEKQAAELESWCKKQSLQNYLKS